MATDNVAKISIEVTSNALEATKKVKDAFAALDNKTISINVQTPSDVTKNLKDLQNKTVDVKVNVDDSELRKIKGAKLPVGVQGGIPSPGDGIAGAAAVGALAGGALGGVKSSFESIREAKKDLETLNQNLKFAELNLKSLEKFKVKSGSTTGGDVEQNLKRRDEAEAKIKKFTKDAKDLNASISTAQKELDAEISKNKFESFKRSATKIIAGFVLVTKAISGIADAFVAYSTSSGDKLGNAANALADSIPFVKGLKDSLVKVVEVIKTGDTLENQQAKIDAFNKKSQERQKAIENINKAVKDYIDGISNSANTFALSGSEKALSSSLEKRNQQIKAVIESTDLSIQDKQDRINDIIGASQKDISTILAAGKLQPTDNSEFNKANQERLEAFNEFITTQNNSVQAAVDAQTAAQFEFAKQQSIITKANNEFNATKNAIDERDRSLDPTFSGFGGVDLAASKKQTDEARAVRDSIISLAEARKKEISSVISAQGEIINAFPEQLETATVIFNDEAAKAIVKKNADDYKKTIEAVNDSFRDLNFLDLTPIEKKIQETEAQIKSINKKAQEARDAGIPFDESLANTKIQEAKKALRDFSNKFTRESLDAFNKSIQDAVTSTSAITVGTSKVVSDIRKLEDEIVHLKNPLAATDFRGRVLQEQKATSDAELALRRKTGLQAIEEEKKAALKAAKERGDSTSNLEEIEKAYTTKRIEFGKQTAAEQQKNNAEFLRNQEQLAADIKDAEKEQTDAKLAVEKSRLSATQEAVSAVTQFAIGGISKKPTNEQLLEIKKSNEHLEKVNANLTELRKSRAIFTQ